MKIRYITLLYTLIIVIFGIFSVKYLNSKENYSIDIPKINSSSYEISKALDEGASADSLEKKYDCVILFRDDSDYYTRLISYVKDNYLIIDYEKDNRILGKLIFKNEINHAEKLIERQNKKIIFLLFVSLILFYLFMLILYFSYVRPFKTLKRFSANIAKGNLDFPLPIKKNNYFGSFTESFDIMREELITARENEQRANQSKKELVAELSHDMKTPISTIKANCEVARLKIQKYVDEKNPTLNESDSAIYEDILAKVTVIEQKADMIDKLISNMFHASLEELNSLSVEPRETLSTVIEKDFMDLNYYKKIHLKNPVPECLLFMDELRFTQVIDNIINNSYKYADTDIDVSFSLDDSRLLIEIRDYGPGIPDNEIPLVTEKFFRGTNKSGKNGSGLGLYLASYFMENMNGGLECFNDNGFVVRLFLNKI